MSTSVDPEQMQGLVVLLERELDTVVTPRDAADFRELIAEASKRTGTARMRALRRILSDGRVQRWVHKHAHRPPSRDVYKAREGDRPARFLMAECPAAVPVGETFSLDVSIGPHSGTAEQVRPFAVPPGGAEVELTVQTSPRRRVQPSRSNVASMFVPDEQVAVTTKIELLATAEGICDLIIRAYVGGTLVQSLSIDVHVRADGPVTGTARQQAAIAAFVHDAQGLALEIATDDTGYFLRVFSGHAEKREGRCRLDQSLHGFVLGELGKLAQANNARADASAQFRQTANLGRRLWDHLVPDELRRDLLDALGRTDTLTVLGDSQEFPWELLCPEVSDDSPFIVQRIPLMRVAGAVLPAGRLSVGRAAYVLPSNPPTNAEAELAAVRNVLKHCSQNLGTYRTYKPLQSLVNDKRTYDLLHIAAHNEKSTDAWDRIPLADLGFTPYDVNENKDLANTGRPLVFFNACNTSGSPINTQKDSWAGAFLQAGAGAFVGTNWAVRSSTASRFAEAFYEALIAPSATLGTASLAARSATKDGHDPTWLAYAVYGSAQSKLTESS
ncbi:CHAT domain-containing protein [Lentzea cavernae]|uniref:CHAT domain-containing protein n=1 Tax=Lentzea cavernae TaxID=2020703 RepID=UPI001E53B37C|nr:CHAT domain-containing protein [Lentzea cavernae]